MTPVPGPHGPARPTPPPSRRRLWTLLAVAPLVLALLVLGTRFIALTVTTSRGGDAYRAERFAQAADIYSSGDWLNIVDPWKSPYNEGTSRLRERTPESVESAIDALERAYGLTASQPPETQCLVQTNLALAYETAGDLHAEAGAPEEAKTSYEAALGARDRTGCPQSTVEDQQENEAGIDRVEKKLQEDETGGGSDPDEPDEPDEPQDPSGGESEDPAEAERQAELDEVNKQAGRDAQDERQAIEDTYGDQGGGYVDKKW